MKVGDQVTLTDYKRKSIGKSEADVYKIIKVSAHTETYSSSGCLEYLILSDDGHSHRCWRGHLRAANESR